MLGLAASPLETHSVEEVLQAEVEWARGTGRLDCKFVLAGTPDGPGAQHFAEALARRLGVDPEYINQAFEDPMYYMQRERQLPINVDPVDNHLDDVQERERVRQVFERGLSTPVGMVLPIERNPGRSGPRWQTGLWMLRGQRIMLIPGDSPLGLRLPLASLPWVAGPISSAGSTPIA